MLPFMLALQCIVIPHCTGSASPQRYRACMEPWAVHYIALSLLPERTKWHHVASVGEQGFASDAGHGGSNHLLFYVLDSELSLVVGQFETLPVKHLWERVTLPLGKRVLCTETSDLLDVIVC